MAEDSRAEANGAKRLRTRHGCLNCKNKRRKCDEGKPTCGRCADRGDKCEWASRIVFREENVLGIGKKHTITQHKRRAPTQFKIKDVTAEVIRDYQDYEPIDDETPQLQSPLETNQSSPIADDTGLRSRDHLNWQKEVTQEGTPSSFPHVPEQGIDTQTSQPDATMIQLDMSDTTQLNDLWQSPTASWNFDDSVFFPGSAYLDAQYTLRNHLMYEVGSTENTRHATPDLGRQEIEPTGPGFTQMPRQSLDSSENLYDSRPEGLNLAQSFSPELSPDDELMLWKNWIEEIAPWVDKFDSERHFQYTIPIMARSHDHLRYSILAVSARQLERKQQSRRTERSLSLYQMAIQLVLPELHTRSTPVIASCVVLCVLEMSISSAKAWRQHLDGCAHLIEAVGINGFSGGVNQALFWCFARMDVCSGLIASEKTLIPVERWASGIDLDTDASLFRARNDYNSHACYATYLCAQVLELLAFLPHLAERVGAPPPMTSGPGDEYATQWKKIWRYVEEWCNERPPETFPVFSNTVPTEPFPRILFSNPAAISGTQMYHTAAILLLQHKPSGMVITPKPNSIFWHARQICGISMSNDHHGAWTNSIQPLWIAGQWMSHESEQKAILGLMSRIERETGWGTKWRAEDLKDFWGYGHQA